MKLVPASHPLLHRRCRSDFTLDVKTVQAMFHLLHRCQGLALAAPQVGIDARLFVTNWGKIFIDPMIVEQSAPTPTHEGCLSYPGRYFTAHRALRIVLQDGSVFTDQQAQVIQHEIDHLNGRVLWQ